jgi:PAS domain-containing protein
MASKKSNKPANPPKRTSKKQPPKDPTIGRLENMTQEFLLPTQSFEEIFEKDIEPIVKSPFLFNNFHWVTNIKEQKLAFVRGVERILGYNDEEFTFQKSMDIIHENYRDFVVEYGIMAYRMVQEKEFRHLSIHSYYTIQYPMRKANGNYVLVQMNASVIQTDSLGNPIANYNRFEVLGPYLGVPIVIRPRVYFRNYTNWPDLVAKAENDLAQRVSKILLERLKITMREKEVLTGYADGKNGQEIAEKLGLKTETIKTHSTKALEKSRKNLSHSFMNIKSVADYLRIIEII